MHINEYHVLKVQVHKHIHIALGHMHMAVCPYAYALEACMGIMCHDHTHVSSPYSGQASIHQHTQDRERNRLVKQRYHNEYKLIIRMNTV